MIHKALRSSDLNQMICYMRSSDLNQMIHESAPKFQSESNDSRYAKSDLNQMIHEPTPKFRSESNDSRTHSKVPIWIKWFAIRKVWSKSNDSRTHSKVLIWIKWFAIRDPIGALPNSESFCATMVQLIRSVKNLCFTNHYVLYKIITSNVEIGKWMALLIWFWIVNRLNWTIEVTSVILPVGYDLQTMFQMSS